MSDLFITFSVIILILYIPPIVLNYYLAKKKQRNRGAWILLALFFTWLSTVFLFYLTGQEEYESASYDSKVIENVAVNKEGTHKPEPPGAVKKIFMKEIKFIHVAGPILILFIIFSIMGTIRNILRGEDWHGAAIILTYSCVLFALFFFLKPLRRYTERVHLDQSSSPWALLRASLLLALFMGLVILPLSLGSALLAAAFMKEGWSLQIALWSGAFVLLSYVGPFFAFGSTFDVQGMPENKKLALTATSSIVVCCINLVVTVWRFGAGYLVATLITGALAFFIWWWFFERKTLVKRKTN